MTTDSPTHRSSAPMRPFTSTISLEEARRRLAAAIRPIARTERVTLADAAGRVVASGVTSSIDVPPFARSAMDGYAVVAADTAGATRDTPVRLGIAERIYTGQMPRGSIAPRSVRRNRDRRADARGRRRRGDGRGHRPARRREPGNRRRGRDLHAGNARAEHRPPRRRHHRRRARGQGRRPADAGPRRIAGGRRLRRRGGVRTAAGGDSVDRQRGRRSRTARWRPARSSTSTASRSPPSSTLTAACPSGTRRSRTRSTR